MSQRAIKRNRKEVRRAVDKNFGIGMEALGNLTRLRPKWIPKRVWILVYAPLFKREYLGAVLRHMK